MPLSDVSVDFTGSEGALKDIRRRHTLARNMLADHSLAATHNHAALLEKAMEEVAVLPSRGIECLIELKAV